MRRRAVAAAAVAVAAAAAAVLGEARAAGEGSEGDPLLWGQGGAGGSAGCRSVDLGGVPGFEAARSFGNCGCAYVDARTLDRATFERDYSEARRPVVLTHATEGWPASEAWGADFLGNAPWGALPVSVEGAELSNPCETALRINERHRYEYPYVGYELDDFLMECIADYNGAQSDTPAAALEKKQTTLSEFAAAALGREDASYFANRLGPDQVFLADLPEEVAGKCHLPRFLVPAVDFLEDIQGSSGGGRSPPTLELGGSKSRSRLHLDGAGRTSWTVALKGQRLVAIWPLYIDLDAFGPQPSESSDATSMVADHNPFNRLPPQISHVQKWNKRTFGDADWDWDAGRSFGPRQGAEHMFPVQPAECVVNEGEVLVVFDSWQTAYNPAPSVALSGRFIDRYAAPGVAWVEFLHSSSLNYWKENNSAMSLYRSIGRNDPDFMPVFLKALAARAQATQAALAAAEEGRAWTFGRYYEASQKNFMAHREGATPWGQPGKAFFESSGYWPLFSAWAEGVVPEIPSGFFEHEIFRNEADGGMAQDAAAPSSPPATSFDGEF